MEARQMDLDKNIENLRKEFDLLKYWVFLNAGASMIPGTYWLKAEEDFLDFQRRGLIETIPVAGIAAHPYLTHTYYECIERAAKLINAKPVEVTNMYRVVTAANLVIKGMLDWDKTDNVVFTDLTYPSITFILQQVRKRNGIELRRVANVNGEILMSDLEEKIDDHTKLVCINRTTAFCGFTYNVKEVCRLAHKHKALVLDDAMQALGAVEVDVREDDVDFLISGSYKWLCGPEGAGIFYIKENLIEKFEGDWNYLNAQYPGPIPFSRPDHDNLRDWDYPLIKNANRFDQYACVGPTLFGWNATLKFLEGLGKKNIERRVRYLGGYLIKELQNIGCKVLTPVDPQKRHGLIVYTTGSHERDLHSLNKITSPLSHRKPIKVTYRGQGGISGIRVCTHFFNTEEDIAQLIKAQKELL